MDSRQIADLWRTSFGEQCPPAGHLCRDEFQDRWVRIHSLPGSKRYAETESERNEVLRRHNEVATATLGNGGPCILFVTSYSPILDASQFNSWLPAPLVFSPVSELRRPESEEADEVNVFATEVQWLNGGFDTLLTAVAEDSTGQVLFANLWRRTAYSPYDGGADLFLASSTAVATAKKEWRSWLSSREDGL